MKFEIYNLKSFLIFLLLELILAPGFCFALETTYPAIPGIPAITDTSGLGDYISYFFGLAIILAGVLAVVVLATGGVRLIMSAGNVTSRKEATDMIKGSILGMALVATSFMILRTINIQLVKPSLAPLPSVEGIYYINGAGDRKPAPMSESNTLYVPEGYNQILYDCSEGPDLFIWKFPLPNFNGIESAFVETIECGGRTNITATGSFKMAFKTAGVYYFLGEECSGFMSGVQTGGGQVPEPFKNRVKSIMIVNNIPSNIRYGVIFHGTDNPLKAGPCTTAYFIADLAQEQACSTEIPQSPPYDGTSTISSSASFFVWNGAEPETSGTGVDFYSEPWGRALGARAGKAALGNKNRNGTYWNYWYSFSDDGTKSLAFNYAGVNRLPEYKSMYLTFFQRPGSVYLNGNYLVVLYNGQYCQIFFNDIFNLKETEFLATGNNIGSVYVLPIR